MGNRLINPPILVFFLFVVFVSCGRQGNFFKKSSYVSEFNVSKKTDGQSMKLFVPKEKLEIFFGKNFLPIYNKFLNIDNDSEEEYIIALKRNNDSNISFFVFDIMQNDVVKGKFSYDTEIKHENSFSLQVQNFFYQDDISVLVEGKSSNDKNMLYIFSYRDNNYDLFKVFTADFSIIIDFNEIESDKGKYNILKEITVINNFFSSTNTNIKKNNVYKWDYQKNDFYLDQSTEILSENDDSLNSIIYSSEENLFNYIKGFWYPSDYKDIIEKDKISFEHQYTESSKFIYFTDSPKEVNIKYGDYIDKYSIVKTSKLWGQNPGLRFLLKEVYNPDDNFFKFLDIFLVSPKMIKTSGPDKYSQNVYVRLQKPFVEYIIEKKNQITKEKIQYLCNFLNGKFYGENNITLEFNNNDFLIQNSKNHEKGVFKMYYNNDTYLMSFIFDNKYDILPRKNYIISLSTETNAFSLISLKFNLNGYTVDNIKPVIFKKVAN